MVVKNDNKLMPFGLERHRDKNLKIFLAYFAAIK